MTGAGSEPIAAAEFAAALDHLLLTSDPKTIAVACSGGADSLCLTLLTAEFAKHRGVEILALIVDHGLRPEATEEAAQVAKQLTMLKVPHVILSWQGEKPIANLQANARAARYQLLGQACQTQGIQHLLVGHQLEDQAETFLLRLGRGSGVDGLAAMAPFSQRGGLNILRPLLKFSRARIEATLRAYNLSWINDPSNSNPRFTRSRLRTIMPQLDQVGLSAVNLAATAQRLRRARDALEHFTAAHLAKVAKLFSAGWAELDLNENKGAPEEIRLRALVQVLGAVGAQDLPPRLESLERLSCWLDTEPSPKEGGRTLMGCRIIPQGINKVLICREPAMADARLMLAPGESGLWDGRFNVKMSLEETPIPALTIARLGEEGWGMLPSAVRRQGAKLIPEPVRAGLPALWNLEAPLAVPHLRFVQDWQGIGFSAEFCPHQWPGSIVSP